MSEFPDSFAYSDLELRTSEYTLMGYYVTEMESVDALKGRRLYVWELDTERYGDVVAASYTLQGNCWVRTPSIFERGYL